MKTTVRQENVFEENFKIKNQEYTLLTFNKESAPNLREAIAISDRRNERMLTVEEAIMIIADYESKTALSAILHADQRVTWSYLYTGKFSHTAASIGNDWSSRALHIAEHTDSGIYPSPNLLLKKHSAEEHVKFYDIKRTMLKSISR